MPLMASPGGIAESAIHISARTLTIVDTANQSFLVMGRFI